jgi:hypothetical protein
MVTVGSCDSVTSKCHLNDVWYRASNLAGNLALELRFCWWRQQFLESISWKKVPQGQGRSIIDFEAEILTEYDTLF